MEKKRVAVCFYGQMRFFDLLNDFYHTFNDNSYKYQYDFFISTWRDFDSDKLKIPLKGRNYENEEEVTSKWLDQSGKWTADNFGNTRKMTYHFHKVNQLKQNFEIEKGFGYDRVISVRPDILLDFKQLEIELDSLISIRHTVGILDYYRMSDGCMMLDGDYLFISTTEASNIHANMYSYFFLTYGHLKTNKNMKEGGHWVHPFYLSEANLHIQKIKIPTSLIRPERDLEVLKSCINDKHAVNIISNHVRQFGNTNGKSQYTDELKPRKLL